MSRVVRISHYYICWIACAMERSEMVIISGNSVFSLAYIRLRIPQCSLAVRNVPTYVYFVLFFLFSSESMADFIFI